MNCVRTLWQSPHPNANGRYWRILSNGHVERMPRDWKPDVEQSGAPDGGTEA